MTAAPHAQIIVSVRDILVNRFDSGSQSIMLRYLQIQVIVIMMNACKVASIERTVVLKITKLGLEIAPNF